MKAKKFIKNKKKGVFIMEKVNKLYILWTNGDPITSKKMVNMYAKNSLIHGWWEEVTLIVWGKPAQLIAENEEIKKLIKENIEAGVKMTACKACADQLGVSEKLEELGIELRYWGEPLTKVLKNDEKLITI